MNRPARADHLGIAEQGKRLAVEGDHAEALRHYREAIRHAVRQGAPEVFFRHYLECALESLELMGAYDEVLEYCERAVAHYGASPPAHVLARRDLAHVHQRRGAVLLKRGDGSAAAEALEAALASAPQGDRMPLADTLLRWIRARLHVDADRVTAEQRRWRYFAVRKDALDSARAVPLADEREPSLR